MRVSESLSCQITLIISFIFLWAIPSFAQMNGVNQSFKSPNLPELDISINSLVNQEDQIDLPNSESRNSITVREDSMVNGSNRKSTSLTAGYISDTFSLQSDDGTYRFRFVGETT